MKVACICAVDGSAVTTLQDPHLRVRVISGFGGFALQLLVVSIDVTDIGHLVLLFWTSPISSRLATPQEGGLRDSGCKTEALTDDPRQNILATWGRATGGTMRFKVLASAIALGVAPGAHAQNKPTYFVVDASGSMKGEKLAEASALLKSEVSSLVSITYFGGKSNDPTNGGGCDENVVVPSNPNTPEAIVAQFPDLGGNGEKTAMGRALESVLQIAGDQATVVLITDGEEECDADFKSLRQKYPNAEIKVLQVGPTPNPALSLLEIKPRGVESTPASPAPPPPPISPPTTDAIDGPANRPAVSDVWASANWLEKYLWIVAYAFVAGGAAFLGRRFGKMAVKVEGATEELERYRRKSVDQAEKSEAAKENDLPKILSPEDTIADGEPDRIRSVSAFAFALVAGLPLAIFDGVDQTWLGIFWGAIAIILALWLTFTVPAPVKIGLGKKPKIQTSNRPYFPAKRWWRIALGLGLVALTAITFVGTNLDTSRSAAWLVLSSEFSGALAVIAGAPLLFVGAQWWSFERAKFTYHSVVNSVISQEAQQRRAEARKTKTDWDNYRIQLSKWSFPTSFFSSRWLTPFRMSVAQKNRDLVVEKARFIAIKSGDDGPSIEANERYRKLLAPTTLDGFFQALIDGGLVATREEEWRALVDALGSGNSRKIAEAYSQVAVSKH